MARERLYDYLLKIALIGDGGVGKSNLLLRFTDDSFSPSFIFNTSVHDFKIKYISTNGKRIKLQIWDTKVSDLQSRDSFITSYIWSYLRGCSAFFFCFDLSDKQSFQNIRNWIRTVEQYVANPFIKVLVGLKADMVADRVIGSVSAQALADEYDMPYFECSAKINTNVAELFSTTASSAILATPRWEKEKRANDELYARKEKFREATQLGTTILETLRYNRTLLQINVNPSDLLDFPGQHTIIEQSLVRNRQLASEAVGDSKENKEHKRRSTAVVEKPVLLIPHSESKREVASAVKEVKNNPFAFDWSLMITPLEPSAADEIPTVLPEAKKPEPIPDAAASQRQNVDVMPPRPEHKAEQKSAPLSPSNGVEQAQYAACIAKLKAQIQQPPAAEQWQSLQPSLRELEERLFRLDAAGEPWAWAPTDPAPAPPILQPESLPLAHPPAAPRGHMVFLPPPVQQSSSEASSDAATAGVFKKPF